MDQALRNQFAAAALQGLLASPAIVDGGTYAQLSHERIAADAFALADAMMAEASKDPGVPNAS